MYLRVYVHALMESIAIDYCPVHSSTRTRNAKSPNYLLGEEFLT